MPVRNRWIEGVTAVGVIGVVLGASAVAPSPTAPPAQAAPAVATAAAPSDAPPAAIAAPNPACPHARRTAGGFHTRVGFDQCAVPASGEVARRLVVEVGAQDLGTPRADQPVAMTVVIDDSGSMSGEPVEQARAATLRLAASLRPDDWLSVVAFHDQAWTVVPATKLRHLGDLEARLSGLVGAGGTHTAAGLEEALGQVAATPRDAAIDRVVLLSDGQDGDRASAPPAVARLVEAGAAVSTAGLGIGVDDLLLSRLAVDGGGTFAFLREPEAIVARFEEELTAARRVVARDVSVLLPEHPALVVDDVILRSAEHVGGGIRVRLGDLGADPRKLVAHVRWIGGTGAPPPEIVVEGRTPAGAALRRTIPLQVIETDDATVIAASTDVDVAALATKAELHGWFEQASIALRAGDRDKARELAQRGEAALLDTSGGRDTSSLGDLVTPLRDLANAALQAVTPQVLESNFSEIQTRVNSVI